MTTKINGTNTAASPAITGADTDTGLSFGTDTVNINTGGSTRATVDSSGNLNISNDSGKIQLGTSSDLKIYHDGSNSYVTHDNGSGHLYLQGDAIRLRTRSATGNEDYIVCSESAAVNLYHNNSKKFSTTSDGIEVHGSTDSARIEFNDAYSNSRIGYFGLNRFGIDGHDGLEVRDPSDSYATRFKIDSNGHIGFGPHGIDPSSNGGITMRQTVISGTNKGAVISNNTIDSGQGFQEFRSSGTQIGSIGKSGTTSTTYNTGSDYRLKENESPITDGITRLKVLKPYRFNWKADASTRVDGFFAHEVTPAVPEAITGEKDAVDDNNDPIIQQIDQSKLVPLLTAALQEAVAKIEVLETKVAALEAG